ncbi:cache domain-containing sensor histidine kinase [Paenibacillus arenilitoris]|uniref:Sensor histidine kinase n=1 Tax=Paenibacillus arenilitoris TaxID=2772299 RepID=A0A927H8Q4_9BACL|nr:sensor histidine kinase [Paenibacillus arenilitoris]MBD2871938.1 sensor histidine kinase [Paenibacillus arenilitoris]
MVKQQLEKWIIRMTRTMNLRGKFVLLYGLIVFIPTVLLAVGAGYLALHSARANYMLTIEEAVRQSAQSIAFKKQSYDLLATRTATDGELISRLSRDYTNMFETLETVQYVDRSFENTARYLPGIEDFRIYHANPTLVQDGGLLWKPDLSGPEVKAWFDRTIASPDALTWSNAANDKRKLVVTQKILNKYGESYGIVYLLLDYNDVFAEPFNNPFRGAGELYIVDENNKRIIASSEPGEIGDLLEGSTLQRYWDEPDAAESAVGGKLLIKTELNSGWTVAALVHLDQMEVQSRRIFLLVGAGLAFFLILSTFLIMTVLKNIVWRIRKLGTRMTDISQGDFEVTVKNRDRDELGELELLFNDMSGRLGKLVEEITQANLKEREQSFKALQAQINPHFIYNSLSLVRWRAMDMQDKTQVRIIDAMTTFYRLALNNRDNVTRIREEIEHLKAYVEIQQLRYPDRVTVEWLAEPDVMELYTIKLLLQPIVENCYLHGNIMKTPDAVIRIIVFRLDDYVHFEIHDNGKGIPPEALEQIRKGRYAGTKNGFGMNNIRERLKLYFGAEARFEIDSAENEWTVVSIRIPACEDRPERIRGEEG